MAGDEEDVPRLIELVTTREYNDLKKALLTGECGPVDVLDKNGMTPLQHAAYKGDFKACQLLIDHGADVNNIKHDHRYSALHFAGLSGSTECVQLLLKSGSRAYHVNTLGRTATQMAAFVGNHAVVALINNYVNYESIEYYTVPQGLETEPKLQPVAAKPLYDLVMQVNIHPVRIALTVGGCTTLQTHIKQCSKVLELQAEKESKRPENVNEVICLKYHYLSYVLKTLEKELIKMENNKKEDTDSVTFESIIKKWIRGRASDGFEEHLDYYIRDAVKAFPYVELPLFMQVVRNMAGAIGESCSLSTLIGAINGQRAFQDEHACSTCGGSKKENKKCSKCKMVQYCDKNCQRLHWTTHKKNCAQLMKEYEKRQKSIEEEKMNKEENSIQEGEKMRDEHKIQEVTKDTEKISLS